MMTVSTAVSIGFAQQPSGTMVPVYGLPATLDDWLALTEHASAECADCERPGAAVNDVLSCSNGHRWRWPVVVGAD